MLFVFRVGGAIFFRADENAVNLHKTRVLVFFRVEVLFFFRTDKMRGAILFPRGC